MDALIAMAQDVNLQALSTLRDEIEAFIQSLAHPVVVEDEVELFDLTSAGWRVDIQFGKLLFEAWNSSRTFTRRVEESAYRDGDRLGVFVRKPHARETSILEFREFHPEKFRSKPAERSAYRREFVAMLQQEFQGWRLEYISNRSDREHSFSTWFTRGLARQGRTGCAFLGLGKDEAAAAADSVLAFGLIWLNWLRERASAKATVPGLRIYLPAEAVDLNAQRASALNHRAMKLELFEWNGGTERPKRIDAGSSAVEARLVPRRLNEALIARHRKLLRELLGDMVDGLALTTDNSSRFVSVRVAGLEIVRIEGDLSPKIYFGLEGSIRRLNESNAEDFRNFVAHVLDRRNAESEDTADLFYRLQSERWLEHLLVNDISRIDPNLSPDFVYPQVPAFTRTDRGVIDILAATREGRLAVIELKLEEQINLPFQALDYWLRVERLRQTERFQDYGYFPGVAIHDAPPLLYLVVPAFRFHSTTTSLLRYFDPRITVMQVGINDQWRRGIKVLFRREWRSGT